MAQELPRPFGAMTAYCGARAAARSACTGCSLHLLPVADLILLTSLLLLTVRLQLHTAFWNHRFEPAGTQLQRAQLGTALFPSVLGRFLGA